MKKLAISPCTIENNGHVTVDHTRLFEVMLNPATYSHAYSIDYNQKNAMGQSGANSKFSAVNPDAVTFDIVMDGTGVVNTSAPSSGSKDVKTQIQQLKDIVYQYQGNSHQPNHVRLLWGTLIFFGRLKSMSVDYTLFKPTGEPLRAKLALAFVGFMSTEEEALRANRSSPDLTHRVEVKAGDTLPLLCYRIYKDSSYYPKVAAVNQLTNFRHLTPGMRLHFPPLR